ncbi:integral membrane protein, partial [Aureobasidium melanogenum]
MYDRSTQILAVCVLFFILSWLSVGLRVYVKSRLLKQVGWDDAAMLATLIFFTCYLSCQLGSLAHGNGRHRATMTDETAQIGLMYWFFCELFYTLATTMLKFAIGLFFLRIAVNKWHILIIKTIMVCSAVFGLAYFFIVLFQCHPISFWWDLNPNHHGHCMSALVFSTAGYVVSALNGVADWTFGLLPIFIVKDLQMHHHQKVVVAVILGFAAVGSTATIIRIPYIWTLDHYKGEFLWRTADVAIWTTVEMGIGITAGNLGTLRPLMQRLMTFMGISSSTGPGSKTWSKRNRNGTHAYMGSGATPLEDFTGKGAVKTTVTIRGGASNADTQWGGLSRTDSEEEFVPGANKLHDGGILHSVQIDTQYEERMHEDRFGAGNTSPRATQAYERV